MNQNFLHTAPFMVAEVGINHNGELEKALEMIDVAQEAGASAVKFQTFKAAEFISDPQATYTYRSQGHEVTESMLEMFQRYEFNPDEWRKIKDHCQKKEITFLSTPQNLSDLEFLLSLDLPAIKIGSDDLTNLPLLKAYAQKKLPLILSSGMADLSEIDQALNAVGFFEGSDITLLVCTSQYPTPAESTNISRIKTLRDAYPQLKLGFSDHTQGETAAIMAVSLGAIFFEKHFTLDHELAGPDHWFSANPSELKAWINAIKQAHLMNGDGWVRPSEAEKEMRVLARRSVVSLKKIKAGEKLTLENLGLKRPGDGLPPSVYEEIIGKKVLRNLEAGEQLQWGDFQ